jgi:hypothetical protein
MVRIAAVALLFVLAAGAPDALAQNKCVAKGVMGGQAFNLTHCEVAYYEGSQGVTIWFTRTGDLKKGGKLARKTTGAVPASKFSWDLEFDLAPPEKVAAAGPGC